VEIAKGFCSDRSLSLAASRPSGGKIMRSLRDSTRLLHWPLTIMLLPTLLAVGCGQPEPTTVMTPGDRIPFSGNWSPTGTQQVLDLEAGHRAGIFRLNGSLVLTGKQRLTRAFRTDVIGFSDTGSGMVGRSVWTDEHGDRVFSELRGAAIGPGQRIEGNIIGGTGRYEGLRGEYGFEWQRIGPVEGDEIAGRVVGLTGWARVTPAAEQSPTTAGDRK